MVAEEQTALQDETDERELEEAEAAYHEELGNPEEAAADMQADMARTEKEETAKEYQDILIALGFTPHYHDKDKEGNDETNFGIRVMNTKIGVKFNDKNPAGLVWAYELTEGNKKDFYKNGALNQIPLIQKYLLIQEGKEPIPEITVTGKIVERRGGAIIIAITENGEQKECSFGLGAVKKDDDGAFIPAGFSKATEKNPEQKMDIPRDIRLPDFEKELEQVPATGSTKEKDVAEGKGEPQPTKKRTMDQVIKPEEPKEPVTLAEGEKPTVDYYISLIGEITEKVKAEERIAKNEWGYAINMAFHAVTKDMRAALIAELKTETELSESTIEAIAKQILNAKVVSMEKGGDYTGVG